MKELIFDSVILKNTNRYSSEFSLPDYIYAEDGTLDREKTLELMLSED